LSGTVKRSSEPGMPWIFTSKIGAANAPWIDSGQAGGSVSIRIAIPPRFLVTPGPLLMLISVSFTSQPALAVGSDAAPNAFAIVPLPTIAALHLLLYFGDSSACANVHVGRAFGKYLIPSDAMKYCLITDGRLPLVSPTSYPKFRNAGMGLAALPALLPGPPEAISTSYVLTAYAIPTAENATTTAAAAAIQSLRISPSL
jgi:hypothetical protein